MTNRFMAGLLAVLFCAGMARAEDETAPAPAALPVSAAPVESDMSGLSSFFRSRMDGPNTGQFWASGDYLFTFVRGSKLPPLVTTSDAGTPRSTAGVLGAAGSSTLFGDSAVNGDLRSGFRLATGYWFNPEKTLGVEAGFMMTENRAASFSGSSTGGILARPYTDANTGLQQAVLVAFPGSSNGSINARADSGNFYSANIDLAETAYDVGWFRLTSLLGYRYYRYDESVNIQQVINPIPGNIFPFIPGTQIASNDSFHTQNQFHGIDLGFRSQYFWDNWSLDILTKLAIGRVYRTLIIDGEQTVTAPGATPSTQNAGVLALSSNSGTYRTADWKVMPEVGATLNWQLNSYTSLHLGYSFIFLNDVYRAADQIDRTVNTNLFPGANAAAGGPNRPSANLIRADMWIQSISVGLEFTY